MRPSSSTSAFNRCLAALFVSASPLVLAHCVSDDPTNSAQNTADSGGDDASSPDSAAGDATSTTDASTPDVDAGPPPTGTFLSDLVLPDLTVASAISVAPNGDAVIGGELSDNNAVVINGTSYASAGSLDILVTKIAPNDGVKWVKNFGGTGDDRVSGVATDASGNVYVVGYVSFATSTTTITFGASPAVALTAQHTGQSSFLLKLDATDGHALWVSSFDEADTGTSSCDAVTASGANVAVACGSSGNLDVHINEGSLTVAHQTGRGELIAPIDPATGNVASSGGGANVLADYFTASTLTVSSLAFDKSGGLAVAGSIGSSLSGYVPAPSTTVAFTVTRIGTNPSASDAFVVKLGSGLTHSWDKVFGAGTQRTTAAGVALDGSGNVYITGNFQGSVDFGGGPATAVGAADAFVAELDSTGKAVARATFGGTGSSTEPSGIAVDSSGDVVASGTYQNTAGAIKIGSTTLPTTNFAAWAQFTTKFDSKLSAPFWAVGTAYPGATTSSTGILDKGIGIDPATHEVLTTGSLIGTTDFGDGTSVTRANGIYLVRRSQ